MQALKSCTAALDAGARSLRCGDLLLDPLRAVPGRQVPAHAGVYFFLFLIRMANATWTPSATAPATRSFTFGQVLTWDVFRPHDILTDWVYGRRDVEVFLLPDEGVYLVCLVRYAPSRAWVVLDTFTERWSAIASARSAAV